MKPKIHLVLGSGGARGIAHIGVIETLEQQGFEIVSVTGCSMGAVVGGMYCAGFLNAYKEWLLTLTKSKVFSLFDFTFTSSGFVKGEKVLLKMQEMTGDQHIEHFPVKFTAVATDILHNKEVHYRRGNLYKALRASIGIPGVFTPVLEEQSYLVDGGVLNPLPLNLVHKQSEEEWVVAVNINAAPHAAHAAVASKHKAYNVVDLLNTSYDFTQDRLTKLMIQVHEPEVLVELPRTLCSVFEFHKARMLIEAGSEACNKALRKKH